MKSKLPVILGIVIFGGAIAAVALLQAEPRESDLVTPAIKHLQAHYEKLGHKLASDQFAADILARREKEGFVRVKVPAQQQVHFLRLAGPTWKVDADLADHFDAYLKSGGVVDGVPQRILKQVSAGGGGSGPLSDFTPQAYVDWINDGMVGFLVTDYLEGRTSWQFREAFRFKDGAWTPDGEGQRAFSPIRRRP